MKSKSESPMRRLLAALAVIAIVAVASGPAAASVTPAAREVGTRPVSQAPSPAAAVVEPSLQGKFDVGGYALSMSCYGVGKPTVILESDLGATSGQWSKVIAGLSGATRVCAYDRPGLGRSDKATGSRTSRQMASDLHKLLLEAGVRPPYVLVGQGIGGYTVRLYHQTYGSEVAALVLLGAAHPDEIARQKASLPNALGADPEGLKAIMPWLGVMTAQQAAEPFDLEASQYQVRASGGLHDVRLWVVSQRPASMIQWNANTSYSAGDTAALLNEQWQLIQKELAGLTPTSLSYSSLLAGHDLPNDDPALVTTVIVDAVRTIRTVETPGDVNWFFETPATGN
jgi:pimeloyl-ACP methyl ester carboxylesterase